jgi:hypothetical protein
MYCSFIRLDVSSCSTLVLAVMDLVAESFKKVFGRGRSAMADGYWDGVAAAAGMGQRSRLLAIGSNVA